MRDSVPEFEVTVLIRNNRLKKRRLELGFSQKKMAEACGVHRWGEYERMTLDPTEEVSVGNPPNYARTWRDDAVKIANFLCVVPEELWPESVRSVTCNRVIREVSDEEMRVLVGGSYAMSLSPRTVVEKKEMKALVGKVLEALSPRERAVLQKRFGLDGEGERTLGEVVEEGIATGTIRPDDSEASVKCKLGRMKDISRHPSRGRVQQIEAKALKILRHPRNAWLIRPFVESDGGGD